jgi:crooked neck
MDSSRGPPRVRNKAAAPIQISAEQLLREAVDRQEPNLQAPTTRFVDLEELHEYQGRKRKEFEDYVRRNRLNLKNWLQYAGWEQEQKEFARARSVYERALDAHGTNVVLWLRYVDSELKERNIMHAKNLLDRAITLLPRIDKLWWKYLHTSELLGDVSGTREVFERWMQWEPDPNAWSAYIKFETRYQEWDRARTVFERFTAVHPEPENWLKWARWETDHGTTDLVREVFTMAIETLGDDFMDERVFIQFARFEVRLKEFERARALYKFALDRLPRSKSRALNDAYVKFSKAWGDEDGVEDAVLSKRRVQYEEEVKQNPKNYDAWIDLARLEETSRDVDRTREVYERAITQFPPTHEKRHWRRYIYLFLFYATFEESVTGDMERVGQIYQECIKLIPHKKFTFAKVWLNKARFEIRQMKLSQARKTLGQAIGMCPKDKLFKGYIELEIKLFEFARCRTLYEKYLSFNPSNSEAWKSFAELERGLDDTDRARSIFEIAVAQDTLDMPELVWKEYIDFEADEEEYERARALYERLLEKTSHVKVWISYALFEINVPGDEDEEEEEEGDGDEETPVSEEARTRARKVFERAYKLMKEQGVKEDRVALLNAWKSFEAAHGSAEDQKKIEAMMPSRVKKRRKLDDDTFEEYIDWLFPQDDESGKKISNLLQMAQKWRQEQQAKGSAST